MTMRSDFVFAIVAAVSFAPSVPTAAQTPLGVVAAAAGGHPTATTICTGQPVLDDDYIEVGQPIPEGPHIIVVSRPTVFDVQLIGGGVAKLLRSQAPAKTV